MLYYRTIRCRSESEARFDRPAPKRTLRRAPPLFVPKGEACFRKRWRSALELWPLDRLVPYTKNPRTHSDAQVAQIAASIAAFGFNNPILVDTKAGIIAGHGRLLAARKLPLKEVPVIILDHLSEKQKRAYILADNQLALMPVGTRVSCASNWPRFRKRNSIWTLSASRMKHSLDCSRRKMPPRALPMKTRSGTSANEHIGNGRRLDSRQP